MVSATKPDGLPMSIHIMFVSVELDALSLWASPGSLLVSVATMIATTSTTITPMIDMALYQITAWQFPMPFYIFNTHHNQDMAMVTERYHMSNTS